MKLQWTRVVGEKTEGNITFSQAIVSVKGVTVHLQLCSINVQQKCSLNSLTLTVEMIFKFRPISVLQSFI